MEKAHTQIIDLASQNLTQNLQLQNIALRKWDFFPNHCFTWILEQSINGKWALVPYIYYKTLDTLHPTVCAFALKLWFASRILYIITSNTLGVQHIWDFFFVCFLFSIHSSLTIEKPRDSPQCQSVAHMWAQYFSSWHSCSVSCHVHISSLGAVQKAFQVQ